MKENEMEEKKIKSKKEKLNKKLKNKQGITLIALIVTIIILLILAGVTIAMLTGQNGILKQATNARETNLKAEEEEKIKIAVTGSSINDEGLEEILNEENFKNELKNQFGNQELDVVANGDGSFIVTVKNTNRKYYVNDDKTVISSDNIIEINNVEELKTFRDDVNNGNSYEGKVVLLTSDIDLDGEEWNPIGYFDQATDEKNPDIEINKPFRGVFDGGNYTISGISITTNKSYQGLFGFVVNGTVRNVIIGKNNNITGNTKVGGVVGYLYGFKGNVSNCINYSNINCSSGGGIVGTTAGQHTIYNCKNYGNITGGAGILASSNGSDWEQFKDVSNTIINCGNYGNITRESGYTCGGITGFFLGNVINCCNKGEINSNVISVGGIIGCLEGSASNCYNIENVSTTQGNVGGILGETGDLNTNISNCYSLGEISGKYWLGDLIGNKEKTSNINPKNCYTKADSFTVQNLSNAFKEDAENINNGYPILYWE